jgi:phage shock protein E
MLTKLKKLLKISPAVNYKSLINEGALIIDVRTKDEFMQGHNKNAINVPLNLLINNISKIKTTKPIIVVCASGIRSANAKMLLKSKGFKNVYNGGSWLSLQKKID